jgi:transcriptional regulator NrdR family protein
VYKSFEDVAEFRDMIEEFSPASRSSKKTPKRS